MLEKEKMRSLLKYRAEYETELVIHYSNTYEKDGTGA